MSEPRPYLVVVYGPPFSGKTDTAWAIARSMPGRSAVISTDALLDGAIARRWDDQEAELEMVQGQVRLLAAYYLKQRYHLVVEGPFLFERGGVLYSYESHIDQIIALMRNLTTRSLIVQLSLSDEVLRQRAARADKVPDVEAALRVGGAYRARSGPGFRAFDTSVGAAAEIAKAVRAELVKGPGVGGR